MGSQNNSLIDTVRYFEYPQHLFWLRIKKNDFQIRTLKWKPSILGAVRKFVL